MTERQRLPDRRSSITFTFHIGGLGYTATFSRFGDGRPAEVFLRNHKVGSSADVNARDAAVAASLALQHGCDFELVRRAMLRDTQGTPSSPLGYVLDAIGGEGDTP
jgi:ribonucleoside-diphosphate reductase alpha chain